MIYIVREKYSWENQYVGAKPNGFDRYECTNCAVASPWAVNDTSWARYDGDFMLWAGYYTSAGDAGIEAVEMDIPTGVRLVRFYLMKNTSEGTFRLYKNGAVELEIPSGTSETAYQERTLEVTGGDTVRWEAEQASGEFMRFLMDLLTLEFRGVLGGLGLQYNLIRYWRGALGAASAINGASRCLGVIGAQPYLDAFKRATDLTVAPVREELTHLSNRATIEYPDGSGVVEVPILDFAGDIQEAADGDSWGSLTLPLGWLDEVKARMGGTMRIYTQAVRPDGTVSQEREVLSAPMDTWEKRRQVAKTTIKVSSPFISRNQPDPYIDQPTETPEAEELPSGETRVKPRKPGLLADGFNRPGDYINDGLQRQRIRKQVWRDGVPQEMILDDPENLVERIC